MVFGLERMQKAIVLDNLERLRCLVLEQQTAILLIVLQTVLEGTVAIAINQLGDPH